ncbi:MAG: ThiF family adenylyltransferase [Thermoplasmata archaeon]|nr:ThiF family adenylyltransferase [Thermoplasmata archaeon]
MNQNERYARHIILKEIGRNGQAKIGRAKAAVVGAGALGNACANLLARAGFGKIRVIDRDVVEITNLQRQILYTERDVGRAKAEVLATHLRKINREIEVEGITADFNSSNGEELLEEMDVVLDCTDNLVTRFLINDICVKHEIPWIYAGVLATSGMTYNVLPHGPCFRCVFPELPKTPLPTCETAGILNTVPVLFGTIQVTEAIKIVLGREPRKTLAFIDLWNFEVQEIVVSQNPACQTCKHHDFEFLKNKPEHVVKLCGSKSVYFHPGTKTKIDMGEIRKKVGKTGEVKRAGKILKINIDGKEITLFPDGGAIIKGTDSLEIAKSVYAKYIGM